MSDIALCAGKPVGGDAVMPLKASDHSMDFFGSIMLEKRSSNSEVFPIGERNGSPLEIRRPDKRAASLTLGLLGAKNGDES